MSILYFKQRLIDQKFLESRPEEDNGFSYDDHEDFTVLEDGYRQSEAEPVNIDALIKELTDLKQAGANYVSCDWHGDHQELKLYGYEFRKATEDEVKANELKLAEAELARKQKEIERLESQLNKLKEQTS
jgi:hypothetical protein